MKLMKEESWDYLECQVLKGESGLVGWGIRFRTARIPFQTPIDAWPGLGTQPHYEVPGDLHVKQVSICSNKHHVSEADPLTVAQRWLWAGKYQLKKGKNYMRKQLFVLDEQIYCDNEFKCLMPGKKDIVSIRKNKHEQKHLILCNLKELFAQFKSQYPNIKIGFFQIL